MPDQEETGLAEGLAWRSAGTGGLLEDGSLFGEATERSNLAEVQACAVHKRRARSRESVHTWQMWKKNAHCACSGGGLSSLAWVGMAQGVLLSKWKSPV